MHTANMKPVQKSLATFHLQSPPPSAHCVDADCMVQDESPVHVAVAKGNMDTMRILIGAKANVNARNAKVRP